VEHDEQGIACSSIYEIPVYVFFWFFTRFSCDGCLMLVFLCRNTQTMQKMINGMTVSRWACINFSRGVQDSVARTFCNELAQMCQVSGMVVSHPFYFLWLKCSKKFTLVHDVFFCCCRNLIWSLLSRSTMRNPSRWRKLWSMFTMCRQTKPKEKNWSFC